MNEVDEAIRAGDCEKIAMIDDRYEVGLEDYGLACAVDYGQSEIARQFLEGGADPNAANGSILPIALNKEAMDPSYPQDIIPMLLEAGADPNLSFPHGLNQEQEDAVAPIRQDLNEMREGVVERLLERTAPQAAGPEAEWNQDYSQQVTNGVNGP